MGIGLPDDKDASQVPECNWTNHGPTFPGMTDTGGKKAIKTQQSNRPF